MMVPRTVCLSFSLLQLLSVFNVLGYKLFELVNVEDHLGFPIAVKDKNVKYLLILDTARTGIRLLLANTPACKSQTCYAPSIDPNTHLTNTSSFCENKIRCSPNPPHFPAFRCLFQHLPPNPDNASIYHDVVYDGVLSPESRVQGIETVGFPFSKAEETTLSFSSLPISVVTEMFDNPLWEDSFLSVVNGFFGIAGGGLECRNQSPWEYLLQENKAHIFGIDYNKSNTNVNPIENIKQKSTISWLHLFGANETPQPGDNNSEYGEIIWAQPHQAHDSPLDGFSGAPIFNPSICGASILNPQVSNWHLLLDLGSKCLVLPDSMWFSIMRWLPVKREKCFEEAQAADSELRRFTDDIYNSKTSSDNRSIRKPVLCEVDDDVMIDNSYTNLPSLSFWLTEKEEQKQTSTNYKPLNISLNHLLIQTKQHKNSLLCIAYEKPSPYRLFSSSNPAIKLGTLTLQSLYVAVDTQNGKIGFAQKPIPTGSQEKCSKRASCEGEQTYDEQQNLCIDPECDFWMFKSLNDRRECVIQASSIGVFVSLLAFLGLGELIAELAYRYATIEAKHSVMTRW